MNRYVTLLASVVMQFCLGATFSWSIYVQSLEESARLLQGPIELSFSVFYFVFPLMTIFFASLLPLLGPRIFAIAGGIIYGGGWLLASLGEYYLWLTVIGIGVLGGIGFGFSFIVPIMTCIQWFPKRRGVITGMVLGGFGGGVAVFGQGGILLVKFWNATPFEIFRVFGVIFFLVVPLAGLAMRHLIDEERPNIRPLFLFDVLPERTFLILYFTMFMGLVAGFVINTGFKELYIGLGLQVGIYPVSLFALGNAFGGIAWGLIFDRIRPARAIQANLLCQAAVILCLISVLPKGKALIIFRLMISFNFGGMLVVYASSASLRWGAERFGQVYGWLLSASIPAAISVMLVGYCSDYRSFFWPSMVIVVLLFLSSLSVQRTRQDLNTRRE